MDFKDRGLGTQIGISLENFCEYHKINLRECGIGTFQEKTGRDAHRAWCLTVDGRMYYVYLQVAYAMATHMKISYVSSIVLYDFKSEKTLHKTHLNSLDDIKDFYNGILNTIM